MPLNIDFQQILLHMLNFVILFAALWFLLYKPVKKYIDARESEYKKASEDAKQKRAEVDAAIASLEETLRRKEEEAKAERTALAQKAQEAYNKRIAEAEADARAIVEHARSEAEKIRRKAVMDSRDDISEITIKSVENAAMSGGEDVFEMFLAAVEKGGGK